MKTQSLIFSIMISLLAFSCVQVAAQEHKPYMGSQAFERVKTLVGSWEGTRERHMK